MRSVYEEVLGEAFATLHPHVQRAHLAPLAAAGILDVEHGPHWFAPVLVPLMRLPAAGLRQPVRLEVRDSGGGMEWVRRIGTSVLRTRQRAAGPHVVEQAGPGCVAFALSVESGALVYRRAWVSLASVRLPTPVSPHVEVRVSPTVRGWHVDVLASWRGRPVCHYGGDMELA